jgi:hypothetical protein
MEWYCCKILVNLFGYPNRHSEFLSKVMSVIITGTTYLQNYFAVKQHLHTHTHTHTQNVESGIRDKVHFITCNDNVGVEQWVPWFVSLNIDTYGIYGGAGNEQRNRYPLTELITARYGVQLVSGLTSMSRPQTAHIRLSLKSLLPRVTAVHSARRETRRMWEIRWWDTAAHLYFKLWREGVLLPFSSYVNWSIKLTSWRKQSYSLENR